MVQEKYVSFETARLLKEKGFNESCRMVYMHDGERMSAPWFMEGEMVVDNDDIQKVAKYDGWITYTQGDYAFLCPTQSIVIVWLRELHDIHIEIIANRNSSNFYVDIAKKENGTWGGAVQDTKLTWTGETIFEKEFKTAEDACEEIIRYCLKKIVK